MLRVLSTSNGDERMNDPEVMERIMEALEKIAYYIELQVGRQ